MKSTVGRLVVWIIVLSGSLGSSRAARPLINVVVGQEAPQLEQLAARELAHQLGALFGADVHIGDKLPHGAENLILVGSPTTNLAVTRLAGEQWPKLSDQGQVIRS